jgi:hypothetical protein
MFSLQIFTEILIVGLLLLFGLSPLLLLLDKRNQEREGFLPILNDLDVKLPTTFLLLIIAYAVGAAGNRLVDDFWDSILPKPDKKYEQLLVAEMKRTKLAGNTSATSADNLQTIAQAGNRQIAINCDGDLARWGECLKVAEFAVRERSQATQDWFDHRRSYIRLVRAAAVAALLLFTSMAFYNILKRNAVRYPWPYFVIVLFFFVAFTVAHVIANEKYWKRVYEVYIGLPPAASKKVDGS